MTSSVNSNNTSTPPTSRLALLAAAANATQTVRNAVAQTAAAITTTAAAVHTASSAIIGPLPTKKTITMTMVPDWNQQEMKSPLKPASVTVVFGPANTLPQHADFKFTFNVYSIDGLTSTQTGSHQKSIKKRERAILWHEGPFGTYKDGINLAETLTSGKQAVDEFKLVSVMMRPYSEEKNSDALVWTKDANKPNDSHLRVIQGHHYYLNFTFDAGSLIAQKVGLQSYRPIVYLNALDSSGNIKASRLFTNFVTNWAQGVELPPSAKEEQEAQQTPLAAPQQTPSAQQTPSVSISPQALANLNAFQQASPPQPSSNQPSAQSNQPQSASLPMPAPVLQTTPAATPQQPLQQPSIPAPVIISFPPRLNISQNQPGNAAPVKTNQPVQVLPYATPIATPSQPSVQPIQQALVQPNPANVAPANAGKVNIPAPVNPTPIKLNPVNHVATQQANANKAPVKKSFFAKFADFFRISIPNFFRLTIEFFKEIFF